MERVDHTKSILHQRKTTAPAKLSMSEVLFPGTKHGVNMVCLSKHLFTSSRNQSKSMQTTSTVSNMGAAAVVQRGVRQQRVWNLRPNICGYRVQLSKTTANIGSVIQFSFWYEPSSWVWLPRDSKPFNDMQPQQPFRAGSCFKEESAASLWNIIAYIKSNTRV